MVERPWTPEIEVGPELAQGLVREQFGVEVRSLERLGVGWDNVAYLIDGDLVVRFPQRRFALQAMAAEIRWLSELAARLPVPIPAPVHVGVPSADYPWPFAAYRLLPGRTACSPAPTAAERTRLAGDLGHFLGVLHALPTPRSEERPPRDTIGRMDLPRCARVIEQRIEGEEARLGAVDWERVLSVARADATVLRSDEPSCWVHGDLYLRHLLLDDGRLSGVIDWGDVHVGERAVDLSVAFSLFAADDRERFLVAYGTPPAAETLSRARCRALYHSTALLHYGVTADDPALAAAGRAGLRSALDSL